MKFQGVLIFISLSLGVTLAYPQHVQQPQDANFKKAENFDDFKQCFLGAIKNLTLCLVTGQTHSDWSSESWENVGYGKVLKSLLTYDNESEEWESESSEEEHEEPSELESFEDDSNYSSHSSESFEDDSDYSHSSESFEDDLHAGHVDQCFLLALNGLVNCVSGGEYFF